MAATATAGFGYGLVRRLVTVPGAGPVPQRSFGSWVVPDGFIWPLLGALGLLLLGSHVSGPYTLVAWNALVFIGSIYFYGGLTVAAFLLERRKAPRIFLIGLLLAVAVLPMLAALLAVVGVFDTWWDWRRLRTLT